MCRKEGRQAGRLTNWFAGGLLVWTAPVSHSSSRAFGPELGTEPLASSLSTRQRAAGLVQQLSGETVCVYCFPCGCQRHKGSRGGREKIYVPREGRPSEWMSQKVSVYVWASACERMNKCDTVWVQLVCGGKLHEVCLLACWLLVCSLLVDTECVSSSKLNLANNT